MAKASIGGTITGTGATESIEITRLGNALLDFSGADATVALERSWDNVNFFVVSKDSVPNPAQYTADVNSLIDGGEDRVYYRFNCTAYTSGTIQYRISQ